jgi:hypothetical protein
MKLQIVKAAGTYSYHAPLKGEVVSTRLKRYITTGPAQTNGLTCITL